MISAALYKTLLALLNARKSKILTYAQIAMTEHQFRAFKSLFLDELGERGLEKDLKAILIESSNGKYGNGRE